MRKSLRTLMAVCAIASMTFIHPLAAYADENYGPGFVGGLPIDQNDGQQTQEETTVSEETQAPSESTSEGQVPETPPAEEQPAETPPAEENIDPATLPRLQTTVMGLDNVWSRPFVNDEWISADGEGKAGFQSISIFLTNTVGNVLYRAYTSEHGWTPWVMNGQQTQVYLDGSQIEMIQMRITGFVDDRFNIYYTSKLNDGTENDWASNGQSTGTMGKDKAITWFRMALFGQDVAWPYSTTKLTDSDAIDGIQTVDGQLRCFNADGSVHNGWAWQNNDRYYFQDSVPVTGWQYIDGLKYYFDESGKNLTDLEPVLGAGGPFQIKINKEMNCTTIYTKDGDNGFIIPYKTFLCSTGDDTPLGTFKTPEKYRWRLMIHDVYTQYATRLYAGGDFLMHSVIYDRQDARTLQPETYNYLGIARSAGCIRYAVEDCKWIYDHCPIGTTVTVYNSSVPGPFDRPAIHNVIPATQTWDPTDPAFK